MRRRNSNVVDRRGSLIVGRYRVKELLGVGGMGSVWIAEHLALKREVVVKFQESFIANGNEIALTRFLREAKHLAAVRHRNVIEHFASGTTAAGEPVLVMERLHGETLMERARATPPLQVIDSLEITIQIAAGLEAVHSGGVIHRDVKPENIFLHRVGDEVIPKLLDFGLARSEGADDRVTQVGATVGTPGFMPREQVRGHASLDGRVDLHALGATLYNLLSGQLPYQGRTPMDLVMATVGDQPIPLSRWRPDLAGEIERVVMKSLSPEPDDRYPTARAFADALRQVRGELERGALSPAGAAQARVSEWPTTPEDP